MARLRDSQISLTSVERISNSSFLGSLVGLEGWELVTSGNLVGTGLSDVTLEGVALSGGGVHVVGVHGEVVGGELLLGGNGAEGSIEGSSLGSVGLVGGLESHGGGSGDEEGNNSGFHCCLILFFNSPC